ncbi:YbjN domain-containing protein [Brachybacterium huguangmaarense]|uniref:YbjN domain-containing protein n=1 Tax=Brachybacterium huguangmaarense TaxID=1652028 RepID=A0ABY6FYN1_9MICO|nr:YbjN domain-containing protein [Brachybacterium huguangmaarense]UYG15544.1 YbjN domain-containing protein [Brachybacterium huguangmaarense]
MTSPTDYRLPDDDSSLEALSLQRVEACLERHGYAFIEDDEHPDILRARFDSYPFLFLLAGEHKTILQTRARWNHSVDVARKVEMVKLCNEWNMNRIWPKVYVRREAETVLGMYGEVAIDFGTGAKDEQIDRSIECGLTTIISFFHDLEERLGSSVDELDD